MEQNDCGTGWVQCDRASTCCRGKPSSVDAQWRDEMDEDSFHVLLEVGKCKPARVKCGGFLTLRSAHKVIDFLNLMLDIILVRCQGLVKIHELSSTWFWIDMGQRHPANSFYSTCRPKGLGGLAWWLWILGLWLKILWIVESGLSRPQVVLFAGTASIKHYTTFYTHL